MGIRDHPTYFLRTLYAGQEATVRTRHATMDWFQIGKIVCQGFIMSPYILSSMHRTSCKMLTAWRNFNNLRYVDDSTLMAEIEEELKSLLMKVKEEKKEKKVKKESEKADLKLNVQKTKIMESSPITSQQIDGKTMKTVADFVFLGSKNTADDDCSHEIKRCLALEEKL